MPADVPLAGLTFILIPFMKPILFALTLTIAHAESRSAPSEPVNTDVVIYTATASGVAASMAAARAGSSVVLIEPGTHVGGMLSGGLGHSDVDGQTHIIGGLAAEIYQRMAQRYGKDAAQDAFDFEPHVAEETLRTMLAEARVRVVFGSRLQTLKKDGARIKTLTTTKGDTFSARAFIDAGYEGDLMAAAGVKYVVGREGRERYGESLAGRTELLDGHHQFKTSVSPWSGTELLPWITPQEKLVPTGVGDGKSQSYCFRLCLTDRPGNRLKTSKPEGYDAGDYELLRRYLIASGDSASMPLGIARLPNGKSDVNSQGPVSTDLPGAAWEYPEAAPERRAEIWKQHLDWAHGMMWFLQNDPSVPAKLQTRVRAWGLCRDEFTDTGGWPHQLYIREGRRMLGATVVTQRDLMEQRPKPDSIGMCGYNIDIREVQWVSIRTFDFGKQREYRQNPRAADRVFMEGYLSQPVDPWQIPYRALTPKPAECENLLVPVCASMSTIAFASFRMEPGYMIAGHASGVAAAMAAKDEIAVQKVNMVALQEKLRVQKQVIEPPPTLGLGREGSRGDEKGNP
ncbi:MAG: FAD-dependent oxidoreductase [Pirellulales bacterium]